MERRATSLDARVRRVSDAMYSDGSGQVEIYNSRGFGASFDRTVAYGVLETIAEQDSEMQSGFAFTHGRDIGELDLEAVVQEAVENAAGLLGARPVPTASVPVVLHPHAAAMILGVLASSFSADAVIKRRSLLAGKIGEPVAAEIVTITDDARLKDGLASRPFDGEGVPAGRIELVAGNVITLLKKVVAVASDLRFMFAGGFCGSPTVLIEELPVGGL